MPKIVRYFEDLEIGAVFKSRTYPMDRTEMIEFAEMFDPQPFHTGDLEHENIPPLFADLTCSGYHVSAIAMRLLVESLLRETALLTSPGLDYVKWKGPVREGDVLEGRFEILEKRLSNSDPTRGIVKVKEELTNQNGEQVLDSVKALFVRAR